MAGYLHVPVGKLAPYLQLQGKKRLPAKKLRGRWVIDLEEFHDWLVNLYEEKKAADTGSRSKARADRHLERGPGTRRK